MLQQGLLGKSRQKLAGVAAKGFTADDCFHCGYPPINDDTASLGRLANKFRSKLAAQEDIRATSITTGHRPKSSWRRAVDKTYGTNTSGRDNTALKDGVGRFIFWHIAQPVIYFYLYHTFYGNLDERHQQFAGGVLHREVMYLLSLILCAWRNPAFLLVNINASFQTSIGDKPNLLDYAVFGDPVASGVGVVASDGYAFRFYFASGWRFLLMFVLAPEKFVMTAMLAPDFIDAKGKPRPVVIIIWIMLLLGTTWYDLDGFFAILHEPGELPISLLVAFGVCGVFGAIAATLSTIVTAAVVMGIIMWCCCPNLARGVHDATRARNIGGSE